MESIKVIIAYDEESVREKLAHILRENDFITNVAANVEQLFDLLEKSRDSYDVILLDEQISAVERNPIHTSAASLTKRIRTLYPDTQVIVSTGWGKDSSLEMLRAGAYRYMAKPFIIDEMIVSIQAAAKFKRFTEQRKRQHPEPVKILFLAANPLDTGRLRLDEEIRAVDLALHQTEFRDKFDIRQHWAVRGIDLQNYLLRHKPNIIHFSGHGSTSGEIVLEDNSGNGRPMSVRALSSLFSALKNDIRCVVLNACYSNQQARAIAEHIECVVGMSKAIRDASAISFAAAFYQALGYGKDVRTAFDLGCIQIDMEDLGEQDTPRLLAVRTDPRTLTFVP